MSLYHELKRRNVFRVGIAYLAGSWLLIEVAETIFPLFGFDETPARIMVIVLAIGFPLFLLFSWVFEFTPEGLKKEKDIDRAASVTHKTGKQLDRIIIVLLALALGYFAVDKFVLEPARVSDLVEETAQQARSEALVESYGDKSIAVLPFINMSDDAGNEYFSDGISEELLNLLAQISELRVISRSSAFSFKGKDIAIPKVAKQLNVAHVLEGSVRKAGNRVRITAQLIEARSDTHLWSESYDRELDDIFAVQDEIAAAIGDALKVKLALVAGEAVQPTVIKAANTDAYDAYLRGRELIRLRGRGNLEAAILHLERALRLDNNFAPAHAQLAITFASLGGWAITQEEAMRKATAHLDRAQELKPDLAEVHVGWAMLAVNPESIAGHAREALAMNPSYGFAMHLMYIALSRLGRYEEAFAMLEQLLVIDPLNFLGRFNYGWFLGSNGRVEEAHELADRLLSENPRHWSGYLTHANTSLWFEGKIAEGLSWWLRAWGEDPSDTFNSIERMRGLIWVGAYDEARRVDGDGTYLVDVAEGRFDEAILATRRGMQLDPHNVTAIVAAANVLYEAGRIDEALPLYERLLDLGPEGRPILVPGPLKNELTMRLALARRKAGDEEGAQAAVQIASQDHAARRFAREKNQFLHRTDAMLAAFEHLPDRVIAELKSAIQLGLRDPHVLADPIFEDLWGEPRFVALQWELDAILATEHDKILQLICFNNPIPDNWQPMPETCEGVVEQPVR